MEFATPLHVITKKVSEANLARENIQVQLKAATEALKILRSQRPTYAPPHALVALIEDGRHATVARKKADMEHAICMHECDKAASGLVTAQSIVNEAIDALDDLRCLERTR